jgi:hypothetical protein
LADPPDGGSILLDFLAQDTNPLLLIRSLQQDLSTTCRPQRRLTVTQQLL